MTMRSTKKPRLADADEKEKDTRGDAFDSTADLLRETTAFSLQLLSMLQEHSDANPFALLGALPHVRDELIRKRQRALQLHTITGECAFAVLEFLHVPEVCVLQRTCRGFRAMVKRSLQCSRAVSYRGESIDGRVVRWLLNVYRVCSTFKLAKSCRHWASVSDLWRAVLKYGWRRTWRGTLEHTQQIASKAVYALLDNTDIDPNCVHPDTGSTALWCAAYSNDVDLVRRLLTYTNIDVNPRYEGEISKVGSIENKVRGTTPLMAAAILGHKGVVSLLLADPRCDVNLRAVHTDYNDPNKKKSYEETVLHFAADSGVLEALLASSRVDPNMRCADGRTALYDAAVLRREEAVRALVPCDRVDVNAGDPETGNTPLHFLCGFWPDDSNREFYDLLLRRKDVNKNATNDDGESILMHAAFEGDVYMVRSLLADEEVVVDCVDNDGNTALHCAVHKSANFEKMAICIDALRDSGRFDNKVNLRNKYSAAALHVLLLGKHRPRDALKALLKFPGIDVNAHLDIEENEDYLDTPLHSAVRRGDPNYVELLLGMPGIDLSVRDAEKYTPVALACKFACSLRDQVEFQSRFRVFELLLNAPALDCDLYARNARMLRYVASKTLYFRRTSALKMLLATPRPGIDTRAKSSRGRGSISKRETALQYALRKNPSCPRDIRKEVVSIFKEARRKGI